MNQALVSSKPVEAFEMSFTNRSPLPKKVLKMTPIGSKKEKFTDILPGLGPKQEQNSARIEAKFLKNSASIARAEF